MLHRRPISATSHESALYFYCCYQAPRLAGQRDVKRIATYSAVRLAYTKTYGTF